MRKYIIVFLLLFVWPLLLNAAVSIIGTSGTCSSGESVTISGSGFGTHADYGGAAHNYLNAMFDDFETGSINYNSGFWDATGFCGYVNPLVESGVLNRANSTRYVRQENSGDECIGHVSTSQSDIYMSVWRWYDDEVLPNGNGSNWKIYRIFPPGSNDFVGVINDSGWADGSITLLLESAGSCGTTWGAWGTGYRKSWHFYELFISPSTDSVKMWYDGSLVINCSLTDWGDFGPTLNIVFDSYHSEAKPATTRLYGDDYYLDYTLAHVILGNASTYTASTVREIQLPTSWSTTSINVDFRQGSFTNGNTAYLYVVDSAGLVNANGYPVTIAGPGTPTPPTSVNVTVMNGRINIP